MKLNKVTNKLEVTKIGNIIRIFKIDELLQLINILRNEMSIVGPRPLFPEFNYFYKKHHSSRILVKPGITGLAQIKIRDSTNWKRKFNFDSIYVKNISLRLDIHIIRKTFFVVIKSIFNSKKRPLESTTYYENFFKNYK
jgi:lipopolysaccharide/colanic/teichoic acid biosynthesis glycosyltransferase